MSKPKFRINITTRIFLINALVMIGMAAILIMSLQIIGDKLTQEKTAQTRRLVEVAVSLTIEYQDRVKSGEFTVEEAQSRAMKRLSNLRYDKANYFWINNLDGIMLMHPTSAKLVGTDVRELVDARGDKFFVGMIDKVKKDGAGQYNYYWPPDSTAKEKTSYITGVPAWGWIIGSGVFIDDIKEEIWQAEKKLGAITGIIMLLAFAAAYIIGRSISKPVQSLTGNMQRLAEGDLNVEIGMGKRHDEIGDMAKTVGVFQENARQMEKMKTDNAEQERLRAIEKKQTMEKMANDFEQSVGQIVSIVASASTELQANAKNLSEMADQTSRQSSTVAAATEQASASVQTVASAAEELSASISEINRQVEESTRVAKTAVDEVKHTDATVSSLSEAAAQIGDVVKLIQDIAEQTNLLALNATIEAARAGEAGKGFAVVASEVKNLATQTARATEEISRKIVTVQSVSTEAVSAIRTIGKTIEHISEISGVIATAIQQQSEATKEISNNVQQASAGTSEVSSSIVNVTHAATESRGAANEVLQASSELSQQSERLRGEIQSFLRKVREG